MKRLLQLSTVTTVVCMAWWGLLEAGFWWIGTRWALSAAGPGGVGAAAGALVTPRSVGLAAVGYGIAGIPLGLVWGAVLAFWSRLRARPSHAGDLAPLRVLTSLLALAAFGVWMGADRALAVHPETAQNPAWFQRVPVLARAASYAGVCLAIHRLMFALVDRLTRPRILRWLRSKWLRRGAAGSTLALAVGLIAVPAAPDPPVIRDLGPRPAAASAGWSNVVVVVLDTTRPDHSSAYGYPRPTTPNLEALASEGALFEQAYSTSSWTLPAHASLFTGRYPTEHGATGEHFWLDDRFPTLAERLRARGYRTWAASGNAMVGSISNLDRGFERFLESWRGGTWAMLSLPRLVARSLGREPDEGARESTSNAVRWIRDEGARGPFFLFVNLIEAHAPYAPPEPYRSRFLEGRAVPSMDVYGNRFLDYMLGLTTVSDAELEGLRRLYDGELAYVDARLGEILAALRSSGLWDRTTVAVVGDHGENLGEHRLMDHQLCVYETLTRIPLVLKGPGVPHGVRVAAPVQIHDLFGTALVAAGTPVEGRDERSPIDLAAVARGDVPGRDLVVSEYHRPVAVLKMLAKKLELAGRDPATVASSLERFDHTLRAIVSNGWKLIDAGDHRHELFDLRADPDELVNRSGTGRPEESQLEARLDRWLSSLAAVAGEGGEQALHADDAAKERLRALGYIE